MADENEKVVLLLRLRKGMTKEQARELVRRLGELVESFDMSSHPEDRDGPVLYYP